MNTLSSTTQRAGFSRPLLQDKEKAKAKKKTKSFNLVLDEIAAKMVKTLASRIYPSTQSEVLRVAIQVLDLLVKEHDQGSQFYIKRKGDDKPQPIEILG